MAEPPRNRAQRTRATTERRPPLHLDRVAHRVHHPREILVTLPTASTIDDGNSSISSLVNAGLLQFGCTEEPLPRRLSDKILAAFNQACDRHEI